MSDVGGGRHLKMRASRDGRTVDMIFFSMTGQVRAERGGPGRRGLLPQINDYRGVPDGAAPPGGPAPLLTAQQVSEQALYRKFARGEAISPTRPGR